MATRIGTGPRAVMDAEKGKSSTDVAIYLALLWVYGLLTPVEDLYGNAVGDGRCL